MRLLTTTSSLVRFQSDASADLEVSWSAIDSAAGPTFTAVGDVLVSVTDTTQTTCVTSPASSTVRNVKNISCKNNHASQTAVVTWDQTDGTHTAEIYQVTLLAGESCEYSNGQWAHLDTNGNPYVRGTQFATQALQEAGTDATVAVTPAVQHFHPSACKFWVKTVPGNTNSASYNVTSVADTAAGITVITIATDFSSANWCCQATCESSSDTMSVTNLKFVRIGLSDQAAGTISIEVHDGTATTAVLEDPTSWHVMGFGDQ